MADSENQIQLDLSVTDIRFLNVAIETVARLANGQWSDAFVYTTSASGKMVYPSQISDIIEPKIRPLMGLSPYASFGVGNREDTDAMWDMYTTIRHRLAWDKAIQDKRVSDDGSRKWPEMISVQYDDPTHYGPYDPVEVNVLDEQGSRYRLSFNKAQGDLIRGALETMHELSQGRMTSALRWVQDREGRSVYTQDLDHELSTILDDHLQWLEKESGENRSRLNIIPPFGNLGSLMDKALQTKQSTTRKNKRTFDDPEPGL